MYLTRLLTRADSGKLQSFIIASISLAVIGSMTAIAAEPVLVDLTTERGSNPVYRRGEAMMVVAQASAAANLYCFYQQGDGKIFRIFPNRHHTNPAVAAGTPLQIPGPGMPFAFRFDHALTIEAVTCFATQVPQTLASPLAPDLEPLPLNSMEALREAFTRIAPEASESMVVITIAD